jgi:hypothetical protein
MQCLFSLRPLEILVSIASLGRRNFHHGGEETRRCIIFNVARNSSYSPSSTICQLCRFFVSMRDSTSSITRSTYDTVTASKCCFGGGG